MNLYLMQTNEYIRCKQPARGMAKVMMTKQTKALFHLNTLYTTS